MSKEYLEAWNFIKDQMPNFTFSHLVTEMAKNTDIVDNALNRLESIDNSNPSEALEILDDFKNGLINKEIGMVMFQQYWFFNQIEKVKQALLKAQEPKHYLKWEDLEFKEEDQPIEVLLNGEKYYLSVCSIHLPEMYVVLGNSDFEIIITKKQFFNDLHLEVIENE